MKKTIILLFSASLFASCTNVIEKKIAFSTIEKDVKKIEKDNPQLDSLKVYILNNMVALSKGNEAYKKHQDSLHGFSMVIGASFEKDVKNLFNYYSENKLTYGQLLSEIDTIIKLNKIYKEKFNNMTIEIKNVYKSQPEGEVYINNSLSNLKMLLEEEKKHKIDQKTTFLKVYYNLKFAGL